MTELYPSSGQSLEEQSSEQIDDQSIEKLDKLILDQSNDRSSIGDYFLDNQSIEILDKYAIDEIDRSIEESSNANENTGSILFDVLPFLSIIGTWYLLRSIEVSFPANISIAVLTGIVIYFLLPHFRHMNRTLKIKTDDSAIIDVPITAASIYSLDPFSSITISLDSECDQVRVKIG
jgi:hypothetical protein